MTQASIGIKINGEIKMAKILENVELTWAFLDPENPQENFEKKQWSITANVDKKRAQKFKKEGFIRSLRPVEDKEGNETGKYKITFKQNAETNAGKPLRAPGVFTKADDGTIKPLKKTIVGNGSVGSISFDTFEWNYKGKTGTSMTLKNVLITDLIAYEGDSVDGSEFGKVETAGDEFSNTSSEDLNLDLELDEDY